MQSDSGSTVSVWMTTTKMPTFAALEEDLSCDVCIVGAGIVGLTAAYHLVRAGVDVIILDDGQVCGGETSRTTAHLSCVLDDRFQWLERVHGEKRVREGTASHMAAINRIESIVREENIACDFERVPGYLFLGKRESPEFLDRELEAAKRAGLTDGRRLARVPGLSWDSGPCLEFPHAGAVPSPRVSRRRHARDRERQGADLHRHSRRFHRRQTAASAGEDA